VIAAAWVAAAVGGASSAFAPQLIRRIPEPDPAEPTVLEEPVGDGPGGALDAGAASAEVPVEAAGTGTEVEAPPKVPYAEIGAARGLAVRTALAGGLGAGALAWALGWDWSLLVLVPLVPVLVALSVVDWRTRLLPTWVIRPTYFVTIALVLLASLLAQDAGALARAAIGWAAVGAFYFLLWFINSSGLGYGDVRLSGIIGMALGHVGWTELVTGVWCAFLVGGVVGGLLSLVGVVDRKGVPFGPFMVIGALLGVLLGGWVSSRLG